MENPFQYGRELGITELVDRKEEVAEVTQTITEGGKLFLIGPRRFGKTSILKSAEEKLVSKRAVVLRYNAESFPSLDLLVSSIVADAARNLRGNVERTGEQIRRFFARLRPEVSFNVTNLEWSARLGMSEHEKEQNQVKLLVDALDGLERLAAVQSRPVGLVLDEFQRVIAASPEEAEGQIRAAIQGHRRTGYVFAGSKTRLLTAMTMDASRPFYRLGRVRFIGPIPRADFTDFLRTQFSSSRFRIANDNPIDLILDLAEEVPYNVQLLGHACWETLRSSEAGGRLLTGKVVRDSLERIVRQYDPFYTQLWNGLTSIQQKTLLAVIAGHGVNLQSVHVLRTVGRGASTIRRALEALVARDILREEERLGSVRMRFEDPFFAHWITLFTPKL
jgi:hypothetical protein